MFGSVFRSLLVIGTIYALSPVRLDATTLPSAALSTTKASAQSQKATPTLETSAIQSTQAAALAMVTGGRQAKPQSPPVETANAAASHHQTDQIGELIGLGKDLCLANAALCAEIVRSAAASAATAVTPKTVAAQPTDTAKDKAKPQPTAGRLAPQPDLLGALIDKVAAPAPRAAPEKLVAKAQR